DLSWNLYGERAAAYKTSKKNGKSFHDWLVDMKRAEFVAALGFRAASKIEEVAGIRGEIRPLEVHSIRPARRIGPDGQTLSDIVVEITQTFRPADDPKHRFRSGCTLLVDSQNLQAALSDPQTPGRSGWHTQTERIPGCDGG